jgi:hypothetical protein
VGVAAFGVQIGNATSENLTKLAANLFRLFCDDDGAFGSVKTVHNKVYGL